MPKAKFVPFDSVEHQERRPGVVLSSLVDGDTGATQLSSGVAEFAVGASAPMHYHDAEESVIVIEGEGILMINGEENHVRQYDAAFITPGTDHRLINTGEEPFKIAWSYATVDVTRTLVDE